MRVLLIGVSLLLATSIPAQAPQDRFFDSNGVQIRYIEQGSATHAGDRNTPARPEFVTAIRQFIAEHRAGSR
jgi:hypothetical protein